MKFGRTPWVYDHRDKRMANWARGTPAPERTNHRAKLPQNLGQMMNDSLSCCTCSALGHILQVVSAQLGKMVTVPDQDIQRAYFGVTGGPDVGANMRDALNFVRGKKNNSSLGGHRAAGWAACEIRDFTEIEQSIHSLENAYIGFALPTWYENFERWKDPSGNFNPSPSILHAVNIIDYDRPAKMFHVATWGRIVPTSYAFMNRCLSIGGEAYGILFPEQIDLKTAKAPNGLNVQALMADLKGLAA